MKSGLNLSRNFDDFQEILVQGIKAVLGRTKGSMSLEFLLRNGLTLFQVCPLRPFETSGIVGVVISRIHVAGGLEHY